MRRVRQPPPRRAEVLAFIQAEIAAGRPFPTKQAIRAHMGWRNDASVGDALSGLVRDGQLVRILHPLDRTQRIAYRLAEEGVSA